MPIAEKDVRWAEEPKIGFWERLYLPAIAEGLSTTVKHLFSPKMTELYPEQPVNVPPNYRGVHRLNRDEEGRVRCVACYMCATACPAHCIDIVAAPAQGLDRPRKISRDVRDRRTALHLLRHVRRSLPGRRHRIDDARRPDRSEPRADDFRQRKAVERLG